MLRCSPSRSPKGTLIGVSWNKMSSFRCVEKKQLTTPYASLTRQHEGKLNMKQLLLLRVTFFISKDSSENWVLWILPAEDIDHYSSTDYHCSNCVSGSKQ